MSSPKNRHKLRAQLLATLLFCCVFALSPRVWAACAGDCDGSGETTIDELLRSVNIAIGNLAVDQCAAGDLDASREITIDELVTAVNAALNGCPLAATPSATALASASATPTASPTAGLDIAPIFPASYRNTYVEVRSCRFSVEHDGVAIRVLANPIAAQPYVQNQNPLPIGSVVVKEEYNGSDCSDDTKLVRWRAMRKEEPGFDEDGDWHWQWVNRNRTVRFDDKSTCIGCHRAPACASRDLMCTLPSEVSVPPLRAVFDGLPPALLAASGTSADNVFVVGADPQDGLGPYVLHYNGACWQRLRTGASGSLWWISFKPIDGAFYMVGEGGLILRYDLASGVFERQTTPGTQQLFGIWGERSDSIWAVGGDLSDDSGGGVLWHFDGESWQPVDLGAVLPSGTPTLFKIWGRNEHDIYVVGQNGTILHYDGGAWSKMPSGTTRRLFTVHGNDDVVIATGGFNSAVILENTGSGFVDRTPAGLQQVNGVYVPASGKAVGVGVRSVVALRGPSGWSAAATDLDTRHDFHAVWMDPDGGFWAVGGDLSVDLSQGMLVYGGERQIATEIGDSCQ